MPPSPGAKRVLLAAPRGYCAGVDRAVIAVEKALEHFGAPVYVRKQIVHNVHVVSTLEKPGRDLRRRGRRGPRGIARRLQRPRRLAGRRRRAPPTAACRPSTRPARSSPRCTARRSASPSRTTHILLIGHAGHEEVEGTMGHAPERTTLVAEPAPRSTTVVVDEPRQPRLALADHAQRRRDDGDRPPAARALPAPCRIRRATTSATPRRTARSRSRRSPQRPTS